MATQWIDVLDAADVPDDDVVGVDANGRELALYGVEGEVYAYSSLFTAVVFWAILKWERVSDREGSDRWLILIAYLMGLSIGVHLLNLLAIPAIVMVYYFRNYT